MKRSPQQLTHNLRHCYLVADITAKAAAAKEFTESDCIVVTVRAIGTYAAGQVKVYDAEDGTTPEEDRTDYTTITKCAGGSVSVRY